MWKRLAREVASTGKSLEVSSLNKKGLLEKTYGIKDLNLLEKD